MPGGTISKRTVDAAKPSARDWFLWDDDLPGFGLKVTPAGGKIYVFQYRIARPGEAERTPAKRYTVGKHGPLTPDQARRRAKELAAMVAQGIDPRQQELAEIAAQDAADAAQIERERAEGELRFEKIAETWLEEYELDHRPRSYEQAASAINKHLIPALRGKALPSITRADIQAVLDGIPARQPATRRTVFAYASILFGWAVQRGTIADSPLTGMAKPKAVKARDRVLTDDELRSIWQATNSLRTPIGSLYRVLLLTGQRREEVAGMKWAELDRATATWTIPADRAKNGVASIVPLADVVVAELDTLSLAAQMRAEAKELDAMRWPKAGPVMTIRGGVSLTCYSQAKALLDAEITKVRGDEGPMDAWRVHDLRRTLATGMQRLGIRFEVTEAILNHVSGAKGGVAGVYQRHDWKDEKRAALNAWAAHVEQLLKPSKRASKVVPIRATN